MLSSCQSFWVSWFERRRFWEEREVSGLFLCSYLLQDELLELDSCWASSRIFSMSPLWIEEEEGTCSSPPVRTSSSSCTASRACEAWDSPWFPFPSSEGKLGLCCWVFPFISSSTQDPEKTQTVISIGSCFTRLMHQSFKGADFICLFILNPL